MEPNCTWRGKGVTSQARGMAVAWKTGITQMGMISYLQKKSVKEQRNRKLENLTHSSWGAETTFETTRNPKGFWWCKDNLFMYLSSLLDSFRGATASLRFWFPGSAWHMKGTSSIYIKYVFFFLWPCLAAYGILVLWTGIKPGPLAVRAWNPNHWSTREFS